MIVLGARLHLEFRGPKIQGLPGGGVAGVHERLPSQAHGRHACSDSATGQRACEHAPLHLPLWHALLGRNNWNKTEGEDLLNVLRNNA